MHVIALFYNTLNPCRTRVSFVKRGLLIHDFLSATINLSNAWKSPIKTGLKFPSIESEAEGIVQIAKAIGGGFSLINKMMLRDANHY